MGTLRLPAMALGSERCLAPRRTPPRMAWLKDFGFQRTTLFRSLIAGVALSKCLPSTRRKPLGTTEHLRTVGGEFGPATDKTSQVGLEFQHDDHKPSHGKNLESKHRLTSLQLLAFAVADFFQKARLTNPHREVPSLHHPPHHFTGFSRPPLPKKTTIMKKVHSAPDAPDLRRQLV